MIKKGLKKPTLVYALGGLDEVGKNLYVVEYKDEIVLMDCGQKFGSNLPGVNSVIPDYEYLIKNRKKVKVLIVTHGHEDHIGGIPYLIKQLDIHTIYAPKIGIALLEKKFQEFSINYPGLVEYDGTTVIKTKHFEIEMFLVNHSIPQSYGVSFQTPNGTVVNTGDYKFDFTPVGPSADFEKISEIGEKGVDLLLADSTNSEIPGFTPSESIVKEEIEAIFAEAKGRILIATFASNIDRVAHIVQAAKKNNRKIVVFGRSMVKVIEIGKRIGLIEQSENLFVKPEAIKKIDDENLLILSTGSQGEQMAALSRISRGEHAQVKVKPKDTIVFSSSPIPGNTLSVIRLINTLARLGAKLKIHREDGTLHTSGHAPQGEQRIMFDLMKPRNFMPVHGEYRMQVEHGETAKECGVDEDKVFICQNGDTVELLNGKVSYGKKIHAGIFYIDQNNDKISDKLFQERVKIADNGIIGIYVITNKTGSKLLTSPKIISKGFIYIKENTELIRDIQKMAFYIAKKYSGNKFDENAMSKEMNKSISRFIGRKLKRYPLIKIIFLKK